MTLPFVRSGKSQPGARRAFLLGLGLLPLALALSPRALAAEVDRDDRDRSGKSKGRGNAALQQAIDFELINVNNVLTIIDNRGIIAQDPRTSAGFGFFPGNSPNNYTFGGGLWVGGLVNGTKVVSTAYDASGGFSEFNAGRAAVNGGGADQIICSNNAADLAQWYPEFSDASGQPITFSQKDCVVIYTDTNQARSVRDPIGLEVRQRTMAFTFGDLSQVVFVAWDIVNTGTNTLQDAFVAANFDMDIGDNFQDDRCSAIPFLPPGANNSSTETIATNLGLCWDTDFSEGTFDPNPPGFVGMTFFQGPIDAAGDTLGLTRFTLTTNPSLGRPQPDPVSDTEQYDLLGGIGTRAPFIDATPSDMRFVEISGPIQFAPGEAQRVVVGLIWANVSNGRTSLDVLSTRCFPAGAPCFLPDPNDLAVTELVRVQRAAQVIFDAGFLAPAPPPKPDITLIPGDRQVTIVWSDVSQVPDPFFSIAGDPTNPAFDPLYREFDFEGYVIVRSTSGDPADVDTLAIFDVANDVSVISDTTVQTFTVGDSVLNLVTAVSPIIQLPNTGLQFSFTDQALVNGITYFYDVAPFDFNPSNTLRGPNITLSSGISFQPSAVKGVRPRTNSSAFTAAAASFGALKADGTPCDTDEPTATVDENTGHYTDFVDCSNAIVDVTLTPLRDLNIPSGEFDFVVDSILPNDAINPYSLPDNAGYALAFGHNTVWFHWENSDGSLATAIQPTVGFFNQDFDFTIANETPVGFNFDSDPSDVGGDLSVALTIASDFSVIEDLEVNGQSVHLEELGATAHNERRPHFVGGSSLADFVHIGNVRSIVNQREYAHPGVYAAGGASYELTWAVSGGSYTGTMRKLPGGEIVPQGGQPKGPDNPSTPGDFISGYNWGFIGPGDPAAVRGENFDGTGIFPAAAPLSNTINLNLGDTFGVMVPGQSVYVQGLRTLPADGDTWRFIIDTGSDRSTADPCNGFADAGREPCAPTPPFEYLDVNDGGNISVTHGIVNVYPSSRWRLSIAGGSNDPANIDLDAIKTVPNPYVANAVWDFSQDNQRIEFINLPPECTIRIYTISGNLVRVIEHTDGSGTAVWDLRTRFNLKAASGTYYWHVTTPQGDTKLGLMSIIQNEVGSN
jgi:hypothetical protein